MAIESLEERFNRIDRTHEFLFDFIRQITPLLKDLLKRLPQESKFEQKYRAVTDEWTVDI
jgi:hypothetical protein